MNYRRIILGVVLIFLSLSLYSQDYTDIKSALGKWSGLMSRYTVKMKDCNDLDKLSGYMTELADTITIITPELKKTRDKYPEFAETGPPEKLKDFFIKFEELSSSFSTMTNKLTKLANEHSDNEKYQAAYGKLNLAVYNMR